MAIFRLHWLISFRRDHYKNTQICKNAQILKVKKFSNLDFEYFFDNISIKIRKKGSTVEKKRFNFVLPSWFRQPTGIKLNPAEPIGTTPTKEPCGRTGWQGRSSSSPGTRGPTYQKLKRNSFWWSKTGTGTLRHSRVTWFNTSTCTCKYLFY